MDSVTSASSLERFTQDFWATPYDTARDKALAFTQLARFLADDCDEKRFTERAYDLLYQHCFGHIAHFGRGGFYDSWFSTPERRASWVQYAYRGGAYGFHDRERKDLWGDVERAVVTWLKWSGVGQGFIVAAQTHTEQVERAQLKVLIDKYGCI